MSSSSSNSHNSTTDSQSTKAVVEVFENERRWIGGGFSKKGLFPTERRAFSTGDGSLSWNTLPQAGDALLGQGWVWISEFECDAAADNTECDQDGWSYAVDFSPARLEHAVPQPGLGHFVRRRRITRQKEFDPSLLLANASTAAAAAATSERSTLNNESSCPNCDSHALDSLSATLLQSLAVATLLVQRDATLCDAVTLPLKKKMVEQCFVRPTMPPKWWHKVSPDVRLQHYQEELLQFGPRQQNVLTKALHHLGNNNNKNDSTQPKGLSERMQLVSDRYFGPLERDAMASVILVHVLSSTSDTTRESQQQLYCGRPHCTAETCDFVRLPCPNDGCHAKISRKHVSWHVETTCPFTQLDCPNACGCPPLHRYEVPTHVMESCELRQMVCPFVQTLGCPINQVQTAVALTQHLQDCQQQHFALAVQRMNEHEQVLRKLNQRIGDLERQVQTQAEQHSKQVADLELQLQAMTKKVSGLGRK